MTVAPWARWMCWAYAEAHAGEVIAGECSLAAGDVELDQCLAGGGDVEDFSLAAVLDRARSWLVVLLDHRYPVALADAVVDAGYLDLEIAEFAALCTVVLGAGIEPVDLLVRGVGDQRDLAIGRVSVSFAQLCTACSTASSRVSAMWSCPRAW